MTKLKIGDTEYKIEFTIEASLCEDCVAKTTDFMYLASTANDTDMGDLRSAISSSVASITTTALAMLYGGLQEHHGDEILTMDSAKELAREYLIENKDTGKGDWYSLLTLMLDTMRDDGFFNLIGLDKMLDAGTAQTEKKSSAKATKN